MKSIDYLTAADLTVGLYMTKSMGSCELNSEQDTQSAYSVVPVEVLDGAWGIADLRAVSFVEAALTDANIVAADLHDVAFVSSNIRSSASPRGLESEPAWSQLKTKVLSERKRDFSEENRRLRS